MAGVYLILNRANGFLYIGSAIDPLRRRRQHISDLRRGKHHSALLQKDFDQYGEEEFGFDVLAECEPDEMIAMEQAAMDRLKPEYNVAPVAGSQEGTRHTPEALEKIRVAMKGNQNARGRKK